MVCGIEKGQEFKLELGHEGFCYTSNSVVSEVYNIELWELTPSVRQSGPASLWIIEFPPCWGGKKH